MSTSLKTRYRVEGMDCAACMTKIETAVRGLDGVADASVSVAGHTMVIDHTAKTNLAALAKRVKGLGYEVFPIVEPVSQSSPPASSANAEAAANHSDLGPAPQPKDERRHQWSRQAGLTACAMPSLRLQPARN